MAEPRTVVITGANGFVGGHLVRHFDEAGWTVRALVHRMPVAQRRGVLYETWELGVSAAASLDGAEALIHAALVSYDRPGASRANIDGSARLLAEARAAGVRRTVFLSSMSGRLDAGSQYGRDKRHIAASFDGPSDLVVRPGLVLGNGGLFGRIRSFMRHRRVAPLVGGGRQLFQTIYVEDLASAIRAGLARDVSGTVTVAERQPVRFRELLAETARQDGVRVLFVPVPYRPVAWTLRVASAMGLRLPVTPNNLLGLHGLEAEDVAADLDRLGIEIRDYRSTLRAIVAGESS